MGFPIRKFSDQSAFAAPRDLSQRTTSFIASQRQGIHRMPLRHLIALMIHARLPLGNRPGYENLQAPPRSAARKSPPAHAGPIRPARPDKDQRRSRTPRPKPRRSTIVILCRTRPGDRRCRRRWCPRRVHPLHDVKHRRRSLSFEANSALDGYSRHRTPTRAEGASIGGARRDRTDDLMLAKHALSQLSYGP